MPTTWPLTHPNEAMWPDVPEVRQIEAWLDPGIDLLNKPFTTEALATKIGELLGKI